MIIQFKQTTILFGKSIAKTILFRKKYRKNLMLIFWSNLFKLVPFASLTRRKVVVVASENRTRAYCVTGSDSTPKLIRLSLLKKAWQNQRCFWSNLFLKGCWWGGWGSNPCGVMPVGLKSTTLTTRSPPQIKPFFNTGVEGGSALLVNKVELGGFNI